VRDVQALPQLVITLAGRRLRPAESGALSSVRVRSALAQPCQCLLVWDASGGQIAVPTAGDALRVDVAGTRTPLFVGEVTVVAREYGADGSRRVSVRAYDALHRLRKRQSTRVFPDVDLAGLASALSSGTGLSVVGGGQQLGTVYQCARSDLDLLVEASARVGLYPVVDATALRLVGIAGDGEPVELTLGSTLHSAEIEVSQEPSYRSVATSRWDPGSATGATRRASDRSARAGTSADPAPASVGGGGLLVRADEVISDDGLAAELAQADLDVRSGGEVTAVLVADGDPALHAGGRVRVTGVERSLEGTFGVTEALHVIDASGYESTLITRPVPPPTARRRDQVTLGSVTDVDDPEGRARVKVSLPAYPDLVTPWSPVLISGGGREKGAVVLPDAGDTVLVLLVAGDPAQAVVLGGLYGTGGPPDAHDPGPRGSRFTLRTRDGQSVTLDGESQRLRVADGHGSEIELGPDLLRITAATDLLIEAPGRALRVRAKTVDFEEAP
jgi:phage baseplate assembly protein V